MNEIKKIVRIGKLPTELPINEAIRVYIKRLALFLLIVTIPLVLMWLSTFYTDTRSTISTLAISASIYLIMGMIFILFAEPIHKHVLNSPMPMFTKKASVSFYNIRTRGVEAGWSYWGYGLGFNVGVSISIILIMAFGYALVIIALSYILLIIILTSLTQ